MGILAQYVVRHRRIVLIVALAVLAPALYGLGKQNIEYNLMTYLPEGTPSVIGQRLLDEEFGYGSIAFLLVENQPDWQVERLKARLAEVPGVRSVVWIDDLTDIAIPRQYLDPAILRQFFRDKATALQIVFKEPGSTVETRQALKQIQGMLDPKRMKLTGQTVALAEMRALADEEKPRMLLYSLILVIAVLLVAIPSPVVPWLFMATLGFAIAVNLGLNYFFGYRISYLTNSVVAALQLGVSLDFCIFLWERYREERSNNQPEAAMIVAVRQTSTAVMASSVTTIFGFLALAAMRNRLGADLGVTLARGVFFSLLSCLTILPALLLAMDRYVFAWQHRSIIPNLGALARLVPKIRWGMLPVFLLLFIPAYYGYSRVKVSYDVESTYPHKLPAIQAAREMRKTFGSVDTLNLVTKDIPPYELERILQRLERVPGIAGVSSYHRLVDPAIPSSFVPDEIKGFYVAGSYVNSTIMLSERATFESTAAILAAAGKILRPYRGRAFLAGQTATSGDMAANARLDLPRVNALSMILIFLTLAVSFSSISLPLILILAVQLAVWLNQSVAYYMGHEIFYFGTVAIGAIQLGATVDYAVLLTARFREELAQHPPVEAMTKALGESIRAVLTSAGTLFVAAMGIYAGTSLDLVRGLIVLIARGAVITVGVVILVFPAALLILNPLIARTTLRWPRRQPATEKQNKGAPSSCTAE